MLGNNLPLDQIPGFAWTATQPFLPGVPQLGTLGAVHADTILLSWGCMAFILAGAAIVRPMLVADGPGNAGQAFLEMLYEFTADITHGQIGHHWKTFFPLIAGIFIFVLTANFSGILPWQFIAEHIPNWPMIAEGGERKLAEIAAPSTDFNVTFGLATVALLTYLGSGFWAHGGKYLKLYINPIEWMDLIIRPATLSLRLMMVITADELMRGAALMMVPVLLPAGVMGFEMFIAVIQAFVFALLTSIYIGLTVSHH
jgi:F-type H+-transporting ATPase subunit a